MQNVSGKRILSGVVGSIVAASIAVGATKWWTGREIPIEYRVESVWWHRAIPIERYKWEEREDWKDQVAGDEIQEISTSQVPRSNTTIQVGIRTVRNGKGNRTEEPVLKEVPEYQTKVKYRAKRYGLINTPSKSGTDRQPVWPELKLEQGPEGKPDREGKRIEEYKVFLLKVNQGDPGPYQHAMLTDLQHFTQAYPIGEKVTLIIRNDMVESEASPP